jgi:hypothetical protein
MAQSRSGLRAAATCYTPEAMPVTLPGPDDFHRRRWMMFVDGENFTVRGQAVAKREGIVFDEGPFFKRDVYLWFPQVKARVCLTRAPQAIPMQSVGVRSHYYTSTKGSDDVIEKVRSDLRDLEFDPTVFKRPGDPKRKSKGVDISLSTDMLSNAFMNNYDVAVLAAGDADYLPLVNQVKRLGKVVYVTFYEEPDGGLSKELRLASDLLWNCWPFMRDQWNKLREAGTTATAR